MGRCPECGASYAEGVVACPRCRAVLESAPALERDVSEVVHRVPDAVAGALLCGVLDHHGIPAVLRAATLPGYGWVRRDWSTSAWGEILVTRSFAAEAKAVLADYLQALAEGGAVRDDDVEAGES
jgi:hypothetical protein